MAAPSQKTDDEWITIPIQSSDWRGRKVTKPFSVRVPIQAGVAVSSLFVAFSYLAPATLLIGSAYLSATYFGIKPVTVALVAVAVFLLIPAFRILRDFWQLPIAVYVDREGFIDFRRSRDKILYDDVESYRAVLSNKTRELFRIDIKLKKHPKIVKLPLNLVSKIEGAGTVMMHFMDIRGIPCHTGLIFDLTNVFRFFDRRS